VYRHGNKDEENYSFLRGMPRLASIEQSGMGIMERMNREGGLVVASSTRRYIVYIQRPTGVERAGEVNPDSSLQDVIVRYHPDGIAWGG
jgi:hypothetical protein